MGIDALIQDSSGALVEYSYINSTLAGIDSVIFPLNDIVSDYSGHESKSILNNSAFNGVINANFSVANSTVDISFIPHIRHPSYIIALLSTGYGFVFLCAILGNISVLCVVLKDSRFHSATYYFIANLSCADLLMAFICHPINLLVNIYNGWHFGAFMCKAVPYLQGVAVCASVNTLVVIAIDRYIAICHVMRQRNTKRMAKVILLFIWLLALLLMTPWALYYQTDKYINEVQVIEICMDKFPEPNLPHKQAFFLGVIFLICYVVPLTFIVTCYSLIGYRVWHRDAPGITSSRGVIEKSKIRVIKMLVIVVLLFMFSWMPLYIINLKLLFAAPAEGSEELRIIHSYAIPFAQWLGTSNSCMNPLVYCLFSQKIRGRIKAMLCCTKPETRSLYSSRSHNNSALHGSMYTRESVIKGDTYTNGNSRYPYTYNCRSLYHSRSPRLDSQHIRIQHKLQSTHV